MTKKETNASTNPHAPHMPDAGRRGFIRCSAAWLGMPLLGSLTACGGGDGGGSAASDRGARRARRRRHGRPCTGCRPKMRRTR